MDKSEVDSLDYVTSERSVNIDSDSDTSSSGSSLFKTQCAASPKQRQKNSTAKFVHSSASVQIDSSSDSSLEPRPLTLKAIFERFKKKKRRKRKRKYKPKLRARGRPKGSKNTRLQIDKKQIKDKGTMFPVLELETGRKSLPWRKILSYEQAIARGFFNHIEKLKYEHHLKESLKQMDVGEDLEKDDLDSRRYKCLDDDGSISPIAEEEEEDVASSECDITLVEDSCFIISSHFPKMNECIKQETRKEAPLSNESC